MITSYIKLIDGEVSEIKEQKFLGKIADLIYNPAKLEIVGILLGIKSGLFKKNKFVANVDFLQLYSDGLIVRDEDAVTELDENVKLGKLYGEKYHGLGQKVISTSGQNLGKVFDFLVDSNTLIIQKIHIHNLFSEKLIPATKIISWEGKIITVKAGKETVLSPSQLETSSSE